MKTYISFLGRFQVRQIKESKSNFKFYTVAFYNGVSYKGQNLIKVEDNHSCSDEWTATLYQFPGRDLYLIVWNNGILQFAKPVERPAIPTRAWCD